MLSPIQPCNTPVLETPITAGVSPLSVRSSLEQQLSRHFDEGETSRHQKCAKPSNKREGILRRTTDPVVPRLRIPKTRRPSQSLDRIFTPRPLEAILSERAYLIANLHRQSMQSRQLIAEYSVIELQLFATETPRKTKRRLRKKVGHLRAQLDQAAAQEKTISVRLGEVYTELQSHAAWSEAALWRIPLQQQHQQLASAETSGEGYFYGSGMPFSAEESCHVPQNTPLDPTLPEFIPGQPIYATSDSSSALHFTSTLSNSSALNTVDETSEDECSSQHYLVDGEGDGVYDYNCLDEEASPRSEQRSPEDEDLISPCRKRLSLPCFYSIWPED